MKKKKKRGQLPLRLNILFLFVFLLFSGLILQLGILQILKGEEAQNKISQTENTTSDHPVPRGKMYDRFGRVILDNEPVRSITYTPPKSGAPANEKLELAEKLAEFIDIEDPEKKIREREKKEYWYLINEEEAIDKLSNEEAAQMEPSEQYRTILERITEAEIAEIDWSDSLYEVLTIKKEMDEATELTPHIVKNENVTEKEYARVAEHLDQLPGINATIDWNRKAIYGGIFQGILGTVTDAERGIPEENKDYFLTRGYSRNDRVGISGLEQEYESILRGKKEKIEYITNSSGDVVDSRTVSEGQRGDDLILTIDIELQQKVDKIVREELEKAIKQGGGRGKHVEDALVAMMDPQTGEVLALSGIHYDRESDEYYDQAYRVMTDAHRPGSVVKGATVLSGLQEGVIEPGTRINDTPVKIKSTNEKSSWKPGIGLVNAQEALEVSSNVFMFHIGMRIGGESNYQYNKSINFNPESFTTMKNYFKQFGLGVETGIDYPSEGTGYEGITPPNLLDYSIGQYSTYTTMQLAQYVSTIANDGYRIKPTLVKEIRSPVADKNELGPVLESINPQVLNRIQMDESYLNIVQEGFRLVFEGSQGTAASQGYNKEYKPAGKTGTAQNSANGENVENLSLIGYAPYDEPEIAFSVIVPNNPTGSHYSVNHGIGKRILDAYFDLKKERDENGIKEEIGNEVNEIITEGDEEVPMDENPVLNDSLTDEEEE